MGHALKTLTLTVCLCVWTQRTSGVTDARVGGTAAIPGVATADLWHITWSRGTFWTGTQTICVYYSVSPLVVVSGPGYTGRETCLRDGSLQITDLRTGDSGSYTVLAELNGGFSSLSAIEDLKVWETVSIPAIQAVPQNPVENGSLVLVCKASGTDVSYQWYQGENLITTGGRITLTSNSQTLTLSPCTMNDTGTNFTCMAFNPVSQSNSSYTPTVSYGPDTPVISASPEKPVYLAGSSLILSCTAASLPPALYTWLLNGQSLSKSGSELSFNSLTPNDSGNYTCNTTNNVTNLSNQATWGIRVQESVSIPAIQAVTQNPVENGSLVLICNASGTDVSYQWYKDDNLITSGGRINLTSNSQTLTLSPCTRNDTGTNFTCMASNAVSQFNSSQYTLTVSYGPDTPVISASPEKPVYMAGSTLTLSCTAASHPPALYTWLLNGQSLSKSGPELHFISLTRNDSGNYTCNTTNNVTNLSNQATWGILVQESVSIPAIQAVPQNPVETGSLVLICNASGTDVSYQWYKDDKLITPGGRINLTSNSQNLTLSPCTRSDTGTNFTCRASNAVSQSNSSQYTPTVSYGPDTPVISASPEKPNYLVGSALTLSCTAASHPPALYTWLLNGQFLSKSGPELHFNSLTLNDSGNYTCSTTNNVTNLSNQAYWGIHVLENPKEASDNGLSGGAIAGIVIAAVVVIAGMGVLEYYYLF